MSDSAITEKRHWVGSLLRFSWRIVALLLWLGFCLFGACCIAVFAPITMQELRGYYGMHLYPDTTLVANSVRYYTQTHGRRSLCYWSEEPISKVAYHYSRYFDLTESVLMGNLEQAENTPDYAAYLWDSPPFSLWLVELDAQVAPGFLGWSVTVAADYFPNTLLNYYAAACVKSIAASDLTFPADHRGTLIVHQYQSNPTID